MTTEAHLLEENRIKQRNPQKDPVPQRETQWDFYLPWKTSLVQSRPLSPQATESFKSLHTVTPTFSKSIPAN